MQLSQGSVTDVLSEPSLLGRVTEPERQMLSVGFTFLKAGVGFVLRNPRTFSVCLSGCTLIPVFHHLFHIFTSAFP